MELIRVCVSRDGKWTAGDDDTSGFPLLSSFDGDGSGILGEFLEDVDSGFVARLGIWR